jgi:hypothetical protein
MALLQQKRKPKTGMARLLELAATKKPLVVSAIILACLAAIASFIPYIAVYLVRGIFFCPKTGGAPSMALEISDIFNKNYARKLKPSLTKL